MVPIVWGRRSQVLNAAPPLKSMRMKVRRVGSLRAASPATRERRNSLLPDPVVPPTRPWGPSRTTSSSMTPRSPTPMGVETPGLPHRRRTWEAVTSSSPRRGPSRTRPGREAPGTSSSGSSRRARARAACSASATLAPHRATSSTRSRLWGCSRTPVESSPTSMTVVQAAGRCSRTAATTMPLTRRGTWSREGLAARPRPSRARAGESRPSVSTSESSSRSTWGVGRDSTPSRSRPRRESLTVRCPPSQRPASGPRRRVWGSQEAHSHSWARPGSWKTPTVRSAGPQWVAAWTRRLRARATAPARSPTIPTTPASVRSTWAGAPGTEARASSADTSSS